MIVMERSEGEMWKMRLKSEEICLQMHKEPIIKQLGKKTKHNNNITK